ncbi:MAG: spore coat protein CotJB [Butyricicoccus pullicaecorum]|nr:spore coat protein CotJB [Butyricicoccus pullicaecorum]
MTERQKRMRDVQMYDFALVEAIEYLDGHPNDPNALAYFNTQKQRYQQAVQAYTQRFGPLQAKDGAYTNTWSWMSDPWPWEGVDQ